MITPLIIAGATHSYFFELCQQYSHQLADFLTNINSNGHVNNKNVMFDAKARLKCTEISRMVVVKSLLCKTNSGGGKSQTHGLTFLKSDKCDLNYLTA